RTDQAGVPAEFRNTALDLRNTEALARGRWLYVHGGVGTGKSTMASGTLRGWMAYNHGTARWTTEADMFSDLRGAISRREPESEAIWRYTGPRILVLDDLGTEPPEKSAARLKQIIDARWTGHRPTIITSQLGLDALCRRLAQADADAARAIGSRLSSCISVALDGPDHRRTNGTN
ncbi:MAG: ATP-binding protein, partial [Atopobiaceae bacterium]|nr:ATP-binding protein [Atopobiaceae bacterium]